MLDLKTMRKIWHVCKLRPRERRNRITIQIDGIARLQEKSVWPGQLLEKIYSSINEFSLSIIITDTIKKTLNTCYTMFCASEILRWIIKKLKALEKSENWLTSLIEHTMNELRP